MQKNGLKHAIQLVLASILACWAREIRAQFDIRNEKEYSLTDGLIITECHDLGVLVSNGLD